MRQLEEDSDKNEDWYESASFGAVNVVQVVVLIMTLVFVFFRIFFGSLIVQTSSVVVFLMGDFVALGFNVLETLFGVITSVHLVALEEKVS